MIKTFFGKISGKWIFLIIVLLIIMSVSVIRYDLFLSVINVFFNLLIKLLPILGLVFLLMFLSNLFFNAKKISKYIGGKSGLKGWLIAIITGIISTGPIYMWYPLLSDFKKQGMHNKYIATFLYNRSVKIPLLPMMIYYFGIPFTIIFNLYVVIFSIINGLIVDFFVSESNIKTG